MISDYKGGYGNSYRGLRAAGFRIFCLQRIFPGLSAKPKGCQGANKQQPEQQKGFRVERVWSLGCVCLGIFLIIGRHA